MKWVAIGLLIIFLAAVPSLSIYLLPHWLWVDFQAYHSWYGVLIGFAGLIFVTYEQLRESRIAESKRKYEERDSCIRSLYIEIFNRAARCALDAGTWNTISKNGEQASISRLQKFRPQDPIVYPSLGGRLALVPAKAIAPLMMFYFRLDAVRRDIDKDHKDDVDDSGNLKEGEILRFANRFKETLSPSRDALDELGAHVSDRADLDNELAKAHEDFLKGKKLRALLNPECL